MTTKAEKIAKDPTNAIQEIIDEVQAAADQTQSEAFRYEDFPDGSRVEIRCYPKPRTTGEFAPVPSDDCEGCLHKTDDGRLFRAVAKPVNSGRIRGSVNRDKETGMLMIKGHELDSDHQPPAEVSEWASEEPTRSLRFFENVVVPVELSWEEQDPDIIPRQKPLLTPMRTKVKL